MAANGSLIFHNDSSAGNRVSATVEMYSKASKVSTAYKWQFMGFPVRTFDKYPTFVDAASYVRKYNEAGTGSGLALTAHWIQQQNGAVLKPFTGYEVTQSAAKTYTFAGELVNWDFNSGKLPFTLTAQYTGQHLIGNSYTGAIDISKIVFGSNNAGIIENTIYRYHTGAMSGMREIPYRVMQGRKPDYIIRHAVKGMMPKTRLSEAQMKKLRIVAGAQHEMASQQPVVASI